MKAVLLTILFSASLTLTAQPLGTYERTKGLDYIGIQLLDTGFIKSSAHILNHGAFLIKGDYELRDDTLYLEATPWVGVDSYFEITNQSDSIKPQFGTHRKMDSNFLSLDITVFDENRKIVPNSIITLLGADSEPAATVLANEQGKFYYYDNNGTISALRFIGFFKPLDLELKKFQGYSTSLDVVLRYDDYNTYNKIRFNEKYLFNSTDSTLTYIGIDSLTHILRFKKEYNKH
jgi:hypothetical protein